MPKVVEEVFDSSPESEDGESERIVEKYILQSEESTC